MEQEVIAQDVTLETVEAEAPQVEGLENEVSAPEEVVDAETPEQAEPESEANADEGQHKEKQDPYSPKARKAIKFREKLLANERDARKRDQEQFQTQLAELTQKVEALSKPSDEPSSDDFDTYEEYLKALAVHEWKKNQTEQQEADKEPKRTAAEQQEAQRLFERQQLADQKEQEFRKMVPDYDNYVGEYEHAIAAEFPPEHLKLLLEIDNLPGAAYVLSREGKLEGFGKMPLSLAAAELVAASNKVDKFVKSGQAVNNAPTNPAANTPKPLQGARGVGGQANRSLDSYSSEDLVKWARGQKV